MEVKEFGSDNSIKIVLVPGNMMGAIIFSGSRNNAQENKDIPTAAYGKIAQKQVFHNDIIMIAQKYHNQYSLYLFKIKLKLGRSQHPSFNLIDKHSFFIVLPMYFACVNHRFYRQKPILHQK